ncbi:histone H3-like centromeric protein cid [Scaptodrosophila lebanonensis]|uniref:Histone H3-like centromeric protein cid n=1 Tax=Drosophila lebanonensis TaxID=7225 RepID=A0A6J2UJ19_DROLE|nr:histone H3-like centromeric protein cid [Scaptodrosophila lebanonensis]
MRPINKKKGAQRQQKGPAPFLGDTSISDEATILESPGRDSRNDTDYGLEFTTTGLSAMGMQSRCSTMRQEQRSSQQDNITSSEDDQNENRPPPSAAARADPTPRPQQQRQKQTSVGAQRRKQRKPEFHMRKLAREILKLQTTPNNLIPRLPFSRLVRSIIMEFTNPPFSISKSALEALHVSAEMYLTQRFQDAYLLTLHRGRVTLELRDMALIAFFCKSRGDI